MINQVNSNYDIKELLDSGCRFKALNKKDNGQPMVQIIYPNGRTAEARVSDLALYRIVTSSDPRRAYQEYRNALEQQSPTQNTSTGGLHNSLATNSGNGSGEMGSPAGTVGATGNSNREGAPSGFQAEGYIPVDELNMEKLNGKLLFSIDQPFPEQNGYIYSSGPFQPEYDTPAFNKAGEQAHLDHVVAQNCLAGAANYDADMVASSLGGPGFRDYYANVSIPAYNIPTIKNGDPSIDSWELANVFQGENLGQVVDINQNGEVNWEAFPVGTIFTTGHGYNSYLRQPEATTANGKTYPSHTYELVGFTRDSTGEYRPVMYDYGILTDQFRSYMYSEHDPYYGIIPNGREQYTLANLKPRYETYLNNIASANFDNYRMLNQNSANEFAQTANPQFLAHIASQYGMPFEPAIKRLFSIGAQESDLGYTMNGSWAKPVAQLQYNVGDGLKNFLVDARSTWADFTHADEADPSSIQLAYDSKRPYQYEMEIFNELNNSGAFEGKTQQEIQAMVSQALAAKKAEVQAEDMVDFGVQAPSASHNRSHGPFQVKDDAFIDGLYAGMSEQYGQQPEDISRAFNKLGVIYRGLSRKYPDLSQEQLLDLATVAWNSPSKANDENFVNVYIRDGRIGDDYLNKVKNAQTILYPTPQEFLSGYKNRGKLLKKH